MTTTVFDRVYVWERPVRLYHWVTALATVVLVSTGLVIGRPPVFLTSGDASGFWFGTVRFLHVSAGLVFFLAFLLRIYWMFAGNEYAGWRNFLPITPALARRHLAGILTVLRVDIFQTQRRSTTPHLGHNALAATSYAAIFAITMFAAATGFALEAPTSGWWLPQMFTWVAPLMGGEGQVRLWHHMVAWVFIAFALIHVYLSIFHDVVEAEGEISAMVSGARFVPREEPPCPR